MLKIGIFANPYKPVLKKKLPKILQILTERNITIFCPEKNFGESFCNSSYVKMVPAEKIPALCDMVIAFGGDGTVLKTIQVVREKETPVLAVNVGGLGFLTEILIEDFEQAAKPILEGQYKLEERLILEAKIEGEKTPLYALNELTIEKGRSTRVIEIKVHIDGKYFNDYVADGLIISTPTGSTGYSLSSGGPIVVPTSECFILNPICPHSLTNRPVIIPSDSELDTQIFTDFPEVIVSADNQDVREIPSRTSMKIHNAPFKAKLVKHLDSDYFSLLRNKLNWGEDFRNKLRWSYKR